MRAALKCAAIALILLAGTAAVAQTAGVRAVGFTVGDLDRSVAFFSEVLQFQPESVSTTGAVRQGAEWTCPASGECKRVARMRLGEEHIEITQYLRDSGASFPPDTRANDRWFQHLAIVVSDMQKAYEVLREHHVRFASSWPQKLPASLPNAAGIEAFYFRDPDGHYLELIHFPADKGDPKWQRPTRDLFLGIDHTAVVVSDTESSRQFYTATLGMHVGGSSENYGYEQEHLNGIFGAHLLITSMRGASGPGIEFLQYLFPNDGRPIPDSLKPSDIAYWQTAVLVPGAQASRITHDPDGHVLLIEPAAQASSQDSHSVSAVPVQAQISRR